MGEEKGPKDEAKSESPEQPGLREISEEQLKEILKAHRKWVESGEEQGERADLSQTFLAGADLQEAFLVRANLQKAMLIDANLQKANLIGANLQLAFLSSANLGKARLRDAILRDTDLGDADLFDAENLQAGQLAGANVSNAKLPEAIRDFKDGLEVVAEASKNSRKLFFGMLLGCAYALLTIATTTDVRLLTNSASSPLPIIGAQIPIVLFYIVAPFILLGLYFYFHLYMQRLWEGLARLPAVFPDGRSLDEKAYPWLLTGLVRAHFFKLKWDRPPLSRLQEWISIFLAWMFVPGTLIWFWFRYIPRQDWVGTGLHIVLFTLAVWAGIMFYRLAVGTLRGEETEEHLWKGPLKWITIRKSSLALIPGLIMLGLSLGTINGVRGTDPNWESDRPQFLPHNIRTWLPYVYEHNGLSPFANLQEQDVSAKPSDWSPKSEEVSHVKGVRLRGSNLRYARADYAFLVNADLRSADMRGAILTHGDLRGADLRGANLEKANLMFARLRGANVQDVKLQGAYMHGVNLQAAYLNLSNLQGVDLHLANLQGASIADADLQNASFGEAKLDGADFYGANLKGAKDLTVEQLSTVKTLYGAKLDPELIEQIKKEYPHLLEEPKYEE